MRLQRPSAACGRGYRSRWRDVRNVPFAEGGKRGVVEGATHIGVDARQMLQISRLAVAVVEPRKNAKDFCRPLGGKRCVQLSERAGVEIRIVRQAPLHIA